MACSKEVFTWLSEWKEIQSLLDMDRMVWGGVEPQPFQMDGDVDDPPFKISMKSPSQLPPVAGSRSKTKVSLEICRFKFRFS